MNARRQLRDPSRMVAAIFLLGMAFFAGCTLQDDVRPDPRDPVCGAVVDRTKGVILTFDSRRYYFDSEECRRKFEAHPARYFDPAQYQFYPEP